MPKQVTVTPFQPYIVLKTKNYQKLQKTDLGISHFYEFSMGQKQNAIDAVPDGSIDLLFNIGTREVHTYLSGTVFQAKHWTMGEEDTCFGVRFQPGQGILPKELTMDMLVNKDILIDGNLFGDHLEEKIAQASGLQERADIFVHSYEKMLEQMQEENGKKNLETYVRKRIYETLGTITMNELARETNYSPCYIRRIFKQYQGISPKQFAKIIRFQYLLQVLHQNENRNEMVAQLCGYFDEAHMMKDFKVNTGVTMEQYKQMMGICQ